MWSTRDMAEDTVYEEGLKWKSYDDWDKLRQEDSKYYRVFKNITNFFETVGVACRYGGLDTGTACELLAGSK
jgi:hypothetical protein